MKKQLLIAIAVLAFKLNGLSQTANSNLLMIPCATYEAMDENFKADPQLKAKFEASQAEFEIRYQQKVNDNAANANKRVAATIYTVPVVFHIMGPQNISDQVFITFMENVNKDFAKQGSDTNTISPAFKALYRDAEIRFVLAKRDPTGKCTNGIIRHDNESAIWSQVNPAFNYTGTGTNRWPPNQYMNVYIVDCITSATQTCPSTNGSYIGGYTTLPGTSPANRDAIVYLKSLLGQSNPRDSRTLSHEIGHWLNLEHTFGNNNCTAGAACGNDGVNDTPITKCNFSTCPASVGTNTCDPSNNVNTENIMDYASCPKMFTNGQILRMRTAIESSTGGRNNLWTNSNYIATGITSSYTCSPVAAFDVNKRSVCAGSAVTYTNESQVGSSGSVAWTFEGGNPATSSASSPIVTYATPGTYSVSMVATNPSGTNTRNETSYITVVQGGGGGILPNTHNFDSGSLPGITVINNNSGTVAWALNTNVGADGTSQSIYLNNASQTSSAGHVDMFETAIYNMSNTTNITLSYYYAYAKKIATQADTFKVQYSLDCGGTWVNVLGVPPANSMATASGGVQSAAFTPSASQWKQTNISATILSALNNKPSVKFRYWFKSDATAGSSNNIYIDQINLSGSVGINELENAMDMMVYPNPTNASSTIDFNMPDQKVKISVMDIVGRVVEESDNFSMNGNRASYVVNKNGSLAKGVYIINIYSGEQKVSKKLIIE